MGQRNPSTLLQLLIAKDNVISSLCNTSDEIKNVIDSLPPPPIYGFLIRIYIPNLNINNNKFINIELDMSTYLYKENKGEEDSFIDEYK